MVLVFKTDINKSLETKVRTILSSLKGIEKVNFDFEDCDNVLKILAKHNIGSDVEFLLNYKGFICQEF